MVSERAQRLIRNVIGELDLDLSGLAVMTEAGTNAYVLPPIIAAMAGARQVYAVLPRDGRLSHVDFEVVYQKVAEKIQLCAFSRRASTIASVDIVVNAGNVRPIDRELISKMSSTAVVSLMYEAWEIRPEDVDIPFLMERNVPVLATNEGPLGIWDYCGPLALKMLLEQDIELHKSRILVLGEDKFAASAFRYMLKASLDVEWMFADRDIDWHDIDAVVLSNWAGPVQREGIPAGVEIICLTEQQRMTRTLAYLGPRPVIELHAAGLKIGELLARTTALGLRGEEAENFVLSECNFSQRAVIQQRDYEETEAWVNDG